MIACDFVTEHCDHENIVMMNTKNIYKVVPTWE